MPSIFRLTRTSTLSQLPFLPVQRGCQDCRTGLADVQIRSRRGEAPPKDDWRSGLAAPRICPFLASVCLQPETGIGTGAGNPGGKARDTARSPWPKIEPDLLAQSVQMRDWAQTQQPGTALLLSNVAQPGRRWLFPFLSHFHFMSATWHSLVALQCGTVFHMFCKYPTVFLGFLCFAPWLHSLSKSLIAKQSSPAVPDNTLRRHTAAIA